MSLGTALMPHTPKYTFLTGNGEVGALMRAHDWAATPLGDPLNWPPSLRSALSTCLSSRAVSAIYWGPEFLLLYNDGYRPFLENRHPWALGRPMSEIWPTLWQSLTAAAHQVHETGEGVVAEDQRLLMERDGGLAESFWYYSFAPIRGETEKVEGIFLTALNTTERVLAERRQAFRLALEERLRDLTDPDEMIAAALEALGRHLNMGQVVYAEVEPGGEFVTIAREWNDGTMESNAGRHRLDDYGPLLITDLRQARTVAISDVRHDPRTSSADALAAFARASISGLLNVPVVKGGRLMTVLGIHRATPHAWTAQEVALAEELTARTWDAVERARAEHALRESEAWLAGMFEQAPTFLALLHGPEHRFIRANPGYLRLVGGRPTLGLTVAEALPEVVSQGFVALLDRVYCTGEPYAADGARVVLQATPDAIPEERYVDFVYQPIRDAAGTVTGIFVEGADVTERVRATAALQDSEARGRQTLDSATDYAIISMDLAGQVTQWNEGARRILGWHEEEMRGETLHRILTPEDAAARRLEAELRDALATGRVATELPHLRSSGARFPASCALTLLRDDIGEPVGFVKVLRDRTDERRREGCLALLARASAGLLETPDPDMVLGPLLEEGADLLGYDQAYVYSITPDGTPGDAQLSLTHSVGVGVGERARASLASVPFSGPLCGIVAETGRPLILSHLLATTEPRWAPGRAAGLDAYAGYPILADGRVVGVIAFGSRARSAFEAEELELFATLVRFLSVVRQRLGREAGLERRIEERTAELREREAQLHQAQKMEAIGQLTGGLAHDVNNMLQGIGSALEMVEKRIDAGRLAEVPRLLQAGREGVGRAAALTHGLLAFARRGHLDAKPVLVDEVARGMTDLVRRTVGPAIEVRLRAGDGDWTAQLDRNGLESALLNLAINARDAMPEGGRLTFATRELSLAAADLGTYAATVLTGDFIRVSVTDTGAGMPADVLNRAFEPFFTTKPIGQGTGLGLSQIYGFVQQSGGFVRITSEVDRGTTVHLHFPRAAPTTNEEAAPADLEISAAGMTGYTVLLVEDEPAVRALAAELLRERGYVVLEAEDGPSGLKALAGAARVDLLVTDVGLPGLNGRQLADAARVRRPRLPVLFITGYAGTALDDALPHGMTVIAKPFALDDLIARVAAMLVPPSP